VGELNLNAQKVFLRVLQERKFRPVGGRAEVASDFRLIAATNRDLAQMAEEGRFRQDLYYRLKAISLHLPPLRKRPEDIKALTIYYINHLSEREQIGNKGVDADFMETVAGYRWPGNVRELFHALEQAFVAAGDEMTLFAMHLPAEIRIKVARTLLNSNVREQPPAVRIPSAPAVRGVSPDPARLQTLFPDPMPSIKDFKIQMEKIYLQRLILQTGGDLNAVLKTSNLSRSHFYALLKRHGIDF
jgi:two-component system NtrC family response regulator